MSSPPRSGYVKIYNLWIVAALVCVIGFVMAFDAFSKAGSSGKAPVKPAATTAAPSNDGYLKVDPDITVIPPFDPQKSVYLLTAWSSQGMLHITDAEPLWSMLRPGSVILAQLIKRGPGPEVVTEGVTLRYYFSPDQNITFAQGKESTAKGHLKIQPDSGVFASAPIAVMPYTGTGKFNPYPVATIEVVNNDGVVVAQSRVVVPVSTEMGCKNCHKGDWKVDGKAGISHAAALDVLKTHDRINKTSLAPDAGKGKMENCDTCHSAESRDPGAKGRLNLSAAIHGWHAAYMSGQGAEACASCHPSAPDGATRFMRDLHKDKALNCVSCHGHMEDHALALLKAEQKLGKKNAAKFMAPLKPRGAVALEQIEPRTPWTQEPDCTGCHDFVSKPSSQTASAFNKWAAGADDLFAKRLDNSGMLRCPACHGAQHAVYPARNPYERDRDNMIPMQYQNHARALGAAGKCVSCHGEPMDGSVHHDLVAWPSRNITVPAGAKLMRPAVVFPHAAHKAVECSTCHHTGYVDGKSLACASAGCHDKADTGSAEAMAVPSYYRNAFHGKDRGCMPCHQKLLDAGKAAGPTSCKDCHKI